MSVTILKLVPKAFLLCSFCACALTDSRAQSISIQGRVDAHGKVVYESYLAGQLSVSRDFSAVQSLAFSWTAVRPLKKGDVLPARISADEAWSVETAQLSDAPFDGKDDLPFPVLAQLEHRSVSPAVLKMKIAIKPGVAVHLGGYEIFASKPVSPGDIIPIVCVGNDSLLAVWADPDVTPWFRAFKEFVKPEDRAFDIEAWLVLKNHVDGTVKQ
jgi:hypothetical protein